MLAALAAAPLLLATVSVQAYPVDRRLFQAQYGKVVRCELCHSNGGGTERNAYGRAWQKSGESIDAFKAIEKLDSDGDSVSNIDEIQKGSNPGDKGSTPDNPGARWTRVDQIPVPADQLVISFGPTDEIQALEPTLTPAQVHVVEKAIGRTMTPDERYPTLYFAVKDGKRVAVGVFAYPRAGDDRYTIMLSIGLNGSVQKVVMFRAGPDSPALYQPFLGCLSGRNKAGLPVSGVPQGCPDLPKRGVQLKAITAAVRTSLFTMGALFSKGGEGGGGGGAAQ